MFMGVYLGAKLWVHLTTVHDCWTYSAAFYHLILACVAAQQQMTQQTDFLQHAFANDETPPLDLQLIHGCSQAVPTPPYMTTDPRLHPLAATRAPG